MPRYYLRLPGLVDGPLERLTPLCFEDPATTEAQARVSDRYLDLPENLPQSIQQTADEVAGAGTTYERAIALQRKAFPA